jgi:hypothetical protein
VLSTVQNIGNAVGVALVGLIWFGEQGHGIAAAFGWSLAALAGLLLVVAVVARLLPAARSAEPVPGPVSEPGS